MAVRVTLVWGLVKQMGTVVTDSAAVARIFVDRFAFELLVVPQRSLAL